MEIHKLIDSFRRNRPTIEVRGFDLLLMADPTASRNDRGLFAGRYGVWIGNMYVNGDIKPGDVPELKSALVIYDKNKTQLPSLKDCKSLSELIEWVKDLSDDFKPVRKQSKAKADLEKVYEDDEWVVYVPHSHAAARRGGEGTHWCTASENDYYYNMYSKDGLLYINIRKSDGAKFQFHFETNQFMNADDEPVLLKNIGLSDGIIEFYTKINPKFKFMLKFDCVDDFEDGFARVWLNGKRNFINTEGQLLSQQWFDQTGDFKDGFVRVLLNGKWNFVNTEGQLLIREGFEFVWCFSCGFAKVRLDDEYNFVNTEGRLLSQQWFDNVWDFNDGFARVSLNGKWNFINTEGQILSREWFDRVDDFKDGFAAVSLNGKWNVINTKGQILSKQCIKQLLRLIKEGGVSLC